MPSGRYARVLSRTPQVKPQSASADHLRLARVDSDGSSLTFDSFDHTIRHILCIMPQGTTSRATFTSWTAHCVFLRLLLLTRRCVYYLRGVLFSVTSLACLPISIMLMQLVDVNICGTLLTDYPRIMSSTRFYATSVLIAGSPMFVGFFDYPLFEFILCPALHVYRRAHTSWLWRELVVYRSHCAFATACPFALAFLFGFMAYAITSLAGVVDLPRALRRMRWHCLPILRCPS